MPKCSHYAVLPFNRSLKDCPIVPNQLTSDSTAARMRADTFYLLILSSSTPFTTAFYPIDPTSHPTWNLSYDYSGEHFFDNFHFFTDSDPTKGHVKYLDLPTANSTGLAGFIPDPTDPSSPKPLAYLGVDYTNPTPSGRPSTRLSSIQTFNHALILSDITHMPAPICGTWPAHWILGSGLTWPAAGEIDILENVNDASTNHYTLHTTEGISTANYTGTGAQTGHLVTGNCDVDAPDQDKNVGCSVTDGPTVPSYGTAFNENNGGVFATLIDAFGIRIWFFPRDAIPADIKDNAPNPPGRAMNLPGGNSTWPVPNARFDGSSNAFDDHFRDMQIIFNTAFCGEWAGKVWGESESCSKLAGTCEEYVTGHPEAFEDVWWGIRGVQVWEMGGGGEIWNGTASYPDGKDGRGQGHGDVNENGKDGMPKRRVGGVAGPVEKRGVKRDL